MDDRIVHIEATVNLDELQIILGKIAALDSSPELYAYLADMQRIKDQLADAKKNFDAAELEAKQMINHKATAMYGKEWESIKGEGYKINRQKTGAVYVVAEGGKPAKEFVKVKYSVDRKKVDDFAAEKTVLPKDIIPNPERSQSIRVYVDTDRAEVA